jgi:hypothetical protein
MPAAWNWLNEKASLRTRHVADRSSSSPICRLIALTLLSVLGSPAGHLASACESAWARSSSLSLPSTTCGPFRYSLSGVAVHVVHLSRLYLGLLELSMH